LVNVGTTLLLFSPLLLATRQIENRLDDVRAKQVEIRERQDEAAASVAVLADEVSRAQEELRSTREQLAQAVADRLAGARGEDRQTFSALGDLPSHRSLFAALLRAADLHLIAARGCRIPLHHTGLFLRFEVPTVRDRFQDAPDPDADLDLHLEWINGGDASWLTWSKDESAEDFLVHLVESVIREGEYPGDRLFDPARVFAELRELLQITYESATGGSANPLFGVVEFCPPQWMITEKALISVGKPPGYQIPLSRINEPTWHEQIAGKSWSDMDSFDAALQSGRELFKAGRLAVKPGSSNADDLPF
jgi:hypothetical protein